MSPPHASRFLVDAVQPFEPEMSHANRHPAYRTGKDIERTTDTDDELHAERIDAIQESPPCVAKAYPIRCPC